MAVSTYSTLVHVCEDTNQDFDIGPLLAQAGFTGTAPFTINSLLVSNGAGGYLPAPTDLFMQVDGDTVRVTAANLANYFGNFDTLSIVIEGNGGLVQLNLKVVIDPVNDAPSGIDTTVNLVDGSAYVLGTNTFRFTDIENNNLKSVVFSSLPATGTLLLGGVALTAGAEVSAADIAAGRLSYQPAQGASGSVALSFQVRDDGGTVGCNAADLDPTPNKVTFNLPCLSALGNRVWFDADGDGLQDAGEAGAGGVTVRLLDAGGNVVTTTTTDAGGNYMFTDLLPGTYKVQIVVPAGYQLTTANAGTNDAVDSDFVRDGVGTVTGTSGLVTLAPGQMNTTVDAGLKVCLVKIGDRVWMDANGNGVQDSGEAGVAGVKVTLKGAGADGQFGTADDTVRTTTTDAYGKYLFANVTHGQYKVGVDLPTGTMLTTADAGSNDALDADFRAAPGAAQGWTDVIRVDTCDDNLTVDAGLMRTASLGDRVWLDTNRNGVQNTGELGQAGVTVNLLNASGQVVATQVTDASGNYLFAGLAPGQYAVQVVAPNGYQFTAANAGADDALDSDVLWSGTGTGTATSALVELAQGQALRTLDAGLKVCLGKLGDRVWLDTNGNGVQDAGESGMAGVKVTLKGAGSDGVFGTADDTTRTTTTDANGNYLFDEVARGAYRVGIDLPSGYTATRADAGTDDARDSDVRAGVGATQAWTDTLQVNSAADNLTIDGGLVRTASLGDRVWLDANRNGVQDGGEIGYAGVKVNLLDASGQVVATQTTDAGGNYLFTGVPPGTYAVQVLAPAGYQFTAANAGTNDAIDSDVLWSGTGTGTATSAPVTLAAGETNLSLDAGVKLALASIGDRVWLDANGNGLQDAGETGVAGVQVTLKGAGADGVFGTADDTSRQTTTDANGNYLFADVAQGAYRVGIELPGGYALTKANIGTNDAVDSDFPSTGVSGATAWTGTIQAVNGQANLTVDGGLVCTASLGDRVWLDANGNGVQDAGEAGVAGATVRLLNASGQVVATQATDAGGNYLFTGLLPGQYAVQVVAPGGYKFTTANTGGNDALDSDVLWSGTSTGTATSALVTLAQGETNLTLDAGILQASCVKIVGASSLYEGTSASYTLQLEQALAVDTTVFVTVVNGTAKLVAGDKSDQKIAAGGGWGYAGGAFYPGYYYDPATGKSTKATGPGDQSWDFGVHDTNGYDVASSGSGFYVTIAAGQTTSAAFTVDAWREKVYADLDYLNGRAYREAAWETFSLKLSGGNAFTTFCEPTKTVSIGDCSQYVTYSPIVLDLDGNGIHTKALIDAGGTFDLFGTGHAVQSGWISSGDAFLAVDLNGNGRIDGIGELFGGARGEGFAKLASFDSNGDGVVDARDTRFGELKVWQDTNGNHQTDAGELRTLAQAGIASLNTAYVDQSIEQMGNTLGEAGSAVGADGRAIAMVDVYFNIYAEDAAAALPAPASLLSADDVLLERAFAGGGAAGCRSEAAALADDSAALMRQAIAAMRHAGETVG